MRRLILMLLCLSSLISSGCLFDPNSRFNINRGTAHDEYDQVAKEARGNTESEKETDKLGDWMYSPEAKQINAHLGVAN
jgi:hypothetical protein